MATDKRLAYSPINKDYQAAVSIQLPTTSANQRDSEQVDINNNNNNNNNNHSSNNIDIPVSSSNLQASNVRPSNYCHHQAATRSLLLNPNLVSQPSSSATTGSNSSDDSPTPPPHYHDIPGIVPAYQGRTSGPPPSYDDVVNPNAPPPSYQSLFGQVREARKSSNGLVDLFRQLFLILIGTLGCTMIIGFLLLIPITMILVGIVYVNECRAENIPSFLVIGGFVWIVKNILNCYNQFKKDSSTANRPPPRRPPITAANRSNTAPPPATGVLIIGPTQMNPNTGHSTTLPSISLHEPSASQPIRTRSTREPQAVTRIREPSLIGVTSFKCESMLNYFLIVWFLAGCIVVYRIYEPDYDNPLSLSYCNRTVYLYAFWLMTSAFIIIAIVLSCLCCLMASSLMSCNHGR